jgi:arginine utilization protein RocB
MTDMNMLALRAEHWARTLTAMPSVTGTADEARFAGRLAELLAASAAFAEPPAVWTHDVPGGPHARRCVLALCRGSGSRTVVLTGHFDIVETSCYGALQPLALDPDPLRTALVETIAREPHDARSARAKADLETGDFLPGRGLLDMKGGLAAGLAAIEALQAEGFKGNLLFIAVPDEEGNSAGARAMSQALPVIAAERGLEIAAVVNLDATGDEGDGEDGRVVMLGSVGKLLPSALVVGRAAHVADSFRGFGAAALAGALAAELEWAPELTERTGDETGAGPTLLGMKDSKRVYDVTMPAAVWMYWNVALHRRSPDAVLRTVEDAAMRSAARLAASLVERAGASGIDMPAIEIPIVRHAALRAEVVADPQNASEIERLEADLEGSELSLPDRCGIVTQKLWDLSGRAGPAVVIGFASIPYLPVELGNGDAASRLRSAVDAAIAATVRETGQSIRTIRFFPGISDMSFFGEADERHVGTIADNTPLWSTVLAGAGRFGPAGYPAVNAGPWGRDYHTRLERMHAPYAFEVLPSLLLRIARGVLEAD